MFEISLGVNFRNGNKGVDFYANNGFDNNDKLLNFNVGGDNYTLNGYALNPAIWGYIPTSVFNFKLVQYDDYINVIVTRGPSLTSFNIPPAPNGSKLTGFKLYCGATDSADPANRLYANYIKIFNSLVTPTPTPTSTPTSTQTQTPTPTVTPTQTPNQLRTFNNQSIFSFSNERITPFPLPLVTITTNFATITAQYNNFNLQIDNNVSNFTLYIEPGVQAQFENYFDNNSVLNSYISAYSLSNVAIVGNPIYFTGSAILSTINDEFYTINYYNTGSALVNVKYYDIYPTPSPTKPATPTPTPTPTYTPTPTLTPTYTPTPTITPTYTPTPTITPSRSLGSTPIPTVTLTSTSTPTPTPTPPITPTNTVTNTNAVTPTNTITPTNTPSSPPNMNICVGGDAVTANGEYTFAGYLNGKVRYVRVLQGNPGAPVFECVWLSNYNIWSIRTGFSSYYYSESIVAYPWLAVWELPFDPEGTVFVLQGNCLTPTPTPTNTVTPTDTPVVTVTPTDTPAITPTNTVTPTSTPAVTPTNTVTRTSTPSVTPTKSPTPTPGAWGIDEAQNYNASPTPTPTNTTTQTNTPSITPTNTTTPSITPTNTTTPINTPSITPTNTTTPTQTPTPGTWNTDEAKNYQTPTPTPTPTPSFVNNNIGWYVLQ